MRSLGLDIGDKRTGVAISDPQGILALPLTVINHESEDATMNDIIRLIEQYGIERIVIGLPYSLSGNLGQQANKVIAFAEELSQRLTYNPSSLKGEEYRGDWRPLTPLSGEGRKRGRPSPHYPLSGEGRENSSTRLKPRTTLRRSHKVGVKLWDERLSTAAAERLMAEANTKQSKKKQHRDAIAAAFILQGFLDSLKDKVGGGK